ncbi:MAG: nucleotidyltransferase substrate binding protein [Calditrichae bacterium]|nr:nucleotidyltransferase substrate binding protein [Calditrichota bacterium]MCB9057509.1 nucleotidyltransferase substrate binding protein [Calditrichia bacterium]
MLDLTSLKKAIHSLEETLKRSNDDKLMSQLDDVTRMAIKSGVIKNFEFTYELCWKFMQRWIKENGLSEEAEFPRTRKDLFRLAAKHSLIETAESWFEYGNARNLTSHTYDDEKAHEIYTVTFNFVNDAKYFLTQIELKND